MQWLKEQMVKVKLFIKLFATFLWISRQYENRVTHFKFPVSVNENLRFWTSVSHLPLLKHLILLN